MSNIVSEILNMRRCEVCVIGEQSCMSNEFIFVFCMSNYMSDTRRCEVCVICEYSCMSDELVISQL